MKVRCQHKICLLLTACVNPCGMSYTALQDSDIRRRQYEEALNFYMTKTDVPIVFVENTNCDFREKYKESIFQGRLECLTFDGNKFDKGLGKGYGEYQILMFANEHSQILKSCYYVMKITGRIKVRNINHLLESRTLMLNNVFRCDFRETDYLWSMVVMIESRKLMDLFKEGGHRLNDSKGVYFEHILYEGMVKDKSILTIPFFESPDIDGICGTSNQPYSELLQGDNLQQNLLLTSRFYKNAGRPFMRMIFRLLYAISTLKNRG